MAVEVAHPQQLFNIQLGRRRRELPDCGDLLREGANPFGVHRVTEEGNGGPG